MKEAISNAMLFNIIITFVVILIMFFVGSLSYSKAYKVKNKIIEEIEKEAELPSNPIDTYTAALNAYDVAKESNNIDEWLENIGYRRSTGLANQNSLCKELSNDNKSYEVVSGGNNYQYCVYRIDTCKTSAQNERCGVYYRVTAFMFFDIPIIGELLQIPVSGETITFTQINT